MGLNEMTPHACNSEGEKKETGNFILVKVVGTLRGFPYTEQGYVAMSIRPCKIKEIGLGKVPVYGESQKNN